MKKIKNAHRPEMMVEGSDDCWALINLLMQHGITCSDKEEKATLNTPLFVVKDGYTKLLKGVKTNIRQGTLKKTIGFVLDSDTKDDNRWESISACMKKAGVTDIPKEIPPEGFESYSEEFKVKVGVWLMPDNQNIGNLEDFLHTLIDDKDPLIKHAEDATKEAIEIGVKFTQQNTESNTKKAIMHTWLAWQETPGCPYGTAINAHYFQHNSDLAQRFVDWFKELYEIETE